MICFECGIKHGTPGGHATTFHINTCGWCKEKKHVCQDYKYGLSEDDRPKSEIKNIRGDD